MSFSLILLFVRLFGVEICLFGEGFRLFGDGFGSSGEDFRLIGEIVACSVPLAHSVKH